jgi:hypothetical protein
MPVDQYAKTFFVVEIYTAKNKRPVTNNIVIFLVLKNSINWNKRNNIKIIHPCPNAVSYIVKAAPIKSPLYRLPHPVAFTGA